MINVLIQVEAGSRDRKIYNEKTLEYKGTRRGSHPYPYSYGFIIGTNSEDGGCVDCYLITKDKVEAGSILECEPIGLLEQNEGDEIDHKVLASLPGQDVKIDQALLDELRNFIHAIFSDFQEMHVTIGRVLPREAALDHIQKFREDNS